MGRRGKRGPCLFPDVTGFQGFDDSRGTHFPRDTRIVNGLKRLTVSGIFSRLAPSRKERVVEIAVLQRVRRSQDCVERQTGETFMKHYRPISRMPAIATSALATKINFKTDFALITAGAVDLLSHNIGLVSQALFINSLNLGEFIEVIFDDLIGDGNGG
jgi:hypothetical protein